MATPFQKVYDCFLSKVETDDWMTTEYLDIVKKDWKMLMDSAIMYFRYPHISLDYDEAAETFNEDLTNDEIQILASFMKLEWVSRCVNTWDNIRHLYSSKDFSQANHLDKMLKDQEQCKKDCLFLLDRYDRATQYKPSAIFGKLAGK